VNTLKAIRWKKLLLFLFVLLLLSQIPFAYRRYRLGRLNSAIQQLNSQRAFDDALDGVAEFKGVVHVHSFLGGHSSGNFEEIISAAQTNDLDFVIMTEHPAKDFDTAAMTLSGKHGGVLFVNGNEVRTANGDRLLLIPGDANAAGDSQRSTADVLSRRASGLALAAYPEDFKSWDTAGYNGVEVYNVYTNAREINPLVMFFDGLWSYRTYPDLLFANFYRRPVQSLQKWDEAIRKKGKSFVATPGNDAHANIGLSLNDSSGKTWVGFKLDPYERSFRLVRLHVLEQWPLPGEFGLPTPPDEIRLLSDISAGHCFIGFDIFGDTSGFRFTASDSDETRMMGDEIKLENEVRLSVKLLVQGRIVLLKDGTVVHDDSGLSTKDYAVTEKGSYRVEVYLPQLPKPAGEQPWIISNPIYVR
jgi:hypothetical protein